MENERRAITKLCTLVAHKNVVKALGYGTLPDRIDSYIDMELCDLNLAVYMQLSWEARLERRMQNFSPKDTAQLWPIIAVLQARDIIIDIASGLQFIHTRNEVHRDLKPPNGLMALLNG